MSNGGKREGAGRPKGRPDKHKRFLQTEARKYAEKAVQALVKNLDDDNANVRNQAAKEILDRGYGKAPQAHTGEDGEGPVKVEAVLEIVRNRPS